MKNTRLKIISLIAVVLISSIVATVFVVANLADQNTNVLLAQNNRFNNVSQGVNVGEDGSDIKASFADNTLTITGTGTLSKQRFHDYVTSLYTQKAINLSDAWTCTFKDKVTLPQDSSSLFGLQDTEKSQGIFKQAKITFEKGANTSNVTNMAGMFAGCQSANTNLSSFDTSNVTNMNLFATGAKLDGSSMANWNVSNVTNMAGMFQNSYTLPNTTRWNTEKVTDFSNMFANGIYQGTLENFNFAKAKTLDGMLAGTLSPIVNLSGTQNYYQNLNLNNLYSQTEPKLLQFKAPKGLFEKAGITLPGDDSTKYELFKADGTTPAKQGLEFTKTQLKAKAGELTNIQPNELLVLKPKVAPETPTVSFEFTIKDGPELPNEIHFSLLQNGKEMGSPYNDIVAKKSEGYRVRVSNLPKYAPDAQENKYTFKMQEFQNKQGGYAKLTGKYPNYQVEFGDAPAPTETFKKVYTIYFPENFPVSDLNFKLFGDGKILNGHVFTTKQNIESKTLTYTLPITDKDKHFTVELTGLSDDYKYTVDYATGRVDVIKKDQPKEPGKDEGKEEGKEPETGDQGKQPETGDQGKQPETGDQGKQPETGDQGKEPSKPEENNISVTIEVNYLDKLQVPLNLEIYRDGKIYKQITFNPSDKSPITFEVPAGSSYKLQVRTNEGNVNFEVDSQGSVDEILWIINVLKIGTKPEIDGSVSDNTNDGKTPSDNTNNDNTSGNTNNNDGITGGNTSGNIGNNTNSDNTNWTNSSSNGTSTNDPIVVGTNPVQQSENDSWEAGPKSPTARLELPFAGLVKNVPFMIMFNALLVYAIYSGVKYFRFKKEDA